MQPSTGCKDKVRPRPAAGRGVDGTRGRVALRRPASHSRSASVVQGSCGCRWCPRCCTSCCWWSASASCVSSSSTPAMSSTGSSSTPSQLSSRCCPVRRRAAGGGAERGCRSRPVAESWLFPLGDLGTHYPFALSLPNPIHKMGCVGQPIH